MKIILTLLALTWAIGLQAQTDDVESQIFTVVEDMPEFPGGEKALLNFLDSIEYPKEAMDNNIEGSVFLRVIIEKDGSIGAVEVAKSSRSILLDESAIAHVRNMPQWKPGRQNGKLVRVQYYVPIRFKLTDEESLFFGMEEISEMPEFSELSSDTIIFTMVEEMPEYPGGQDGLMKYLASIIYPSKAKENDIVGTVYAKFVIEKDGEVRNVEVARSSGAGILDSAVVSHVQAMPAWKPGIQRGKPVRVQYVVPVKFFLAGGKSPADKKKKRN